MSEKISQEINEKKSHAFFIKLVLFLTVILFSYIGFKYWKAQGDKERARLAQDKFSNLESGIFDLSDDAKQEDISDLTINEMKERGAEFVYQILLKNQVQIDNLKTDVTMLKGEILKYKNQEKIGKMILTYVDLREKIYGGKNYENEMKNFDILVAGDSDLQIKLNALKAGLPKFKTSETLLKDFRSLIPDLIGVKKYGDGNDVMARLRRNIAKLVVVRRIDEKDPQELDATLVKIEKSLQQNNCAEAMSSATSLEEKYKTILKKFLEDLSISCEVQKNDQEILNFLKSLT